eukprot:CCRYP_018277-RB/>CCRYP_018277-RB protein AED:0.11 eAED:0.11 QI:2700/1/1/1/1/1/2/1094/159
MRAILIISSLAAFAITDGRTIRGAKRDSTERGIRGAVRRCYPIFNQFEECMTNAADDCSREREDYFSCLCQDCDLSFAETSNDASTETRAAITSSNVTSSSFGAALFAQLCDASPETNVLISPLSVYRALELVEDGATANSDNRAELDRLLGPKSYANK